MVFRHRSSFQKKRIAWMVACNKILQILDHPLDLHAQGHALLFGELVARHLGGLCWKAL
jgi:hypothetical protein